MQPVLEAAWQHAAQQKASTVEGGKVATCSPITAGEMATQYNDGLFLIHS